jgi:hypothetical protein
MNLLSLTVELEMSTAMILVLPLILNEIVLGIWLIVKGFSAPAAAAAPLGTRVRLGSGGSL